MSAQPNRRQGDRRQGDRRHGDRRRPPSSGSEDSWLSAWGDPGHSRSPTRSGEASLYDTDLDAGGDSRFIAREALRLVSTDGAALPRILRTYIAARAALGLALVLAPWLAALAGSRPPWPLLLLCLAYATQTVSLWMLHGAAGERDATDRLQARQWGWTIGVDLLAFSLLRLIDPGGLLNYTALLVLPVLMSGVLTQRLVALATAAGVTLLLLLGVWLLPVDGDVLLQLSQAGLAGAGLFLIALLASELAQRLAREERAARNSLELARQQTLLNRLVIEEMAEGVLVVDRRGKVRAINPAARQLLGPAGLAMAVPSPLDDEPGLAALHRALEQAYAQGSWPASARELTLTQADGDLRTVQARARQDKLAAMGRVSAGIAHEIRNPLAAIAQANALLLEDLLPPTQRRLARIVADNVGRLKRIVDDVLTVAPGASVPTVVIDAAAEVAQVCEEWRRAAAPEVQAASRLTCEWPDGALPVRFDAEHLRRVLVNLLDNAARHGSAEPGAVQLRLARGPRPGTATLTVASDGPAIAPEVERHLFEPFFSTRSRGTGLGLYICRELCERHGASMDFRLAPPGARHRNVFGVVMREGAAAPPPTPPAPADP